jgi:hypothetical protein
MKRITLAFLAILGITTIPAVAQNTKPLTPSQEVSPSILVTRIDANCRIANGARSYVKPVQVALRASDWKVVSAADYTAADRTHSATILADVWKRNGKYVWVHSHTWTSSGSQRATQLCFRNDGTLARARQAVTVPGLDAANARSAYFNTDGSLIQKTTAFEVNDPALAKKITDEPFYNQLP